jgi:broad specificity phosphatase PhoE
VLGEVTPVDHSVSVAAVLYLVRHGQTEANARGLLLGRADPQLSELGERQARDLARVMPTGARVVSSPLTRCRQTAEAFGAPVEVDPSWIELDYGELDGRAILDVPLELWRRWRTDPAYVPAGGESLVDLGLRVRSACDELSETARDGDVVVVSHVSPIKAAIAWALGTSDAVAWHLFVAVASVARIGIDEWGPTVRSLNELPEPRHD